MSIASTSDALSVDDLMRLQEGRPTKRRRASSTNHVDGSADEWSSTHAGTPSIEEEEDAGTMTNNSVYGAATRITPRDMNTRSTTRGLDPAKEVHSTFISLGISPLLQNALSQLSIRTPTSVQVACIPHLLSGERKRSFTTERASEDQRKVGIASEMPRLDQEKL